MNQPSSPIRSPARLAALRRTGLLGNLPEESFDRLARLGARLLDTPVALVSLVSEEGQFFKGCVGLPEPWATERRTPLSHSFCQHVVSTGEALVVVDAREHPLVRDNLAVPDLGVIAYAGVPLRTRDGHVLGSLCAIDGQPRQWTEDDVQTLQDLAASVVSEIELRGIVVQHEETEQALRESEARFRLLVDASPELMWLNGPADTPTYHNLRCQEYTALSRDELLAGGWVEMIHPADRVRAFAARSRGLAAGQPYEAEVRLRSHDGEHCWHRVRVVPVRDGSGTTVAWIGAAANIDDIVRAQQAAEAANRAKSQFLATMSHEIRTPLNAVIGYTDLLAAGIGGPLSPQQQQYLQRIKGSGSHLHTLISDVLDLAKVEAGEMQVSRDQVLLKSVAEDALAITQQLIEQKNLQLSDETDCYPAVQFWGDSHRVRQILVNLLSNAAKFTDSGWVRLRCRVHATTPAGLETSFDGPWLAVEVADTGIGIAPAKLSEVFEPFVQVDGSYTRTRKGTGLGLAISRTLARLMAGDLTVESTPGEGSTFTLWLPAVVDEENVPDRRSGAERRNGDERRSGDDRRDG